MTVLRVLLFCLAVSPLLTLLLLGEPHIGALLATPEVLAAMFRTLLVAEAAVPLALLLAVPAVLASADASPALGRFFTALACAPLALPPLWIAGGLRALADSARVPGAHLGALLLAHTAPAAAIAYLLLRDTLAPLDCSRRQTAAASGAGYWRGWALALGKRAPRGLIVAACGAFTVASGYGLVDPLLAPASHPTLGVLLAGWLRTGSDQAPGAGLILAALCLAPIALLLGLRTLTGRE